MTFQSRDSNLRFSNNSRLCFEFSRKIRVTRTTFENLFYFSWSKASIFLVFSHWLYQSYYSRKMRAQYWNHFRYQMRNWHLWKSKKSKSWGPFWSYQLNSTANPAHLPRKLTKWAIMAVLLAPKRPPGFWFFQLPWAGCRIFILCEIHCYFCPHIFWVPILFRS